MQSLHYSEVLKSLYKDDDYKNKVIVYEYDYSITEYKYGFCTFENIQSFIDLLNKFLDTYECVVRKVNSIYQLQFKIEKIYKPNVYLDICTYCILEETFDLLTITYKNNLCVSKFTENDFKI